MSATQPAPLVHVERLTVGFGAGATHHDVVRDVSFEIAPGECLALVGESGSGKSVIARTLVGLTGPGSRVAADRIEFAGRDVRDLPERAWRRLRGARIGFVLQDALASLDQLRKVGVEVGEPLRLHAPLSRRERDAEVLRLLERVGVPEPAVRARQYPHELSGGQRQRALIASAIAGAPELLIADEPTTALDATVAAQIIALLADLKSEGRGLLLVSHDLAVVAALADRIAVIRAGGIVETGSAADVLQRPQAPYTRELLAAVPSAHPRGARLSTGPAIDAARIGEVGFTTARHDEGAPRHDPILRVESVTKRFRGPDKILRTAVDDVSFDVAPGRTLGIVGESGSGKTTTARILLGVERADAGRVRWKGTPWDELTGPEATAARRGLQVVFQDPLSSFDPRYTVDRVIEEALEAAGDPRGPRRTARAVALLDLVRLPSRTLTRRPLELSGGQRQRVAIARALAARPEVIVYDEPVSALDVSVQASVLDLLVALQRELRLTSVFISHDLGVVHHISDALLVMKDGRIVERGDADSVFRDAQHPYTKELLAAVPRIPHATTGIRNGAAGAGA